MKTIVVGFDETEPSKNALARAADLAEAFGSSVIVTSVAPVLVGSREMGGVDPVDSPELHADELAHARTFLAERGLEGQFELAVGDPATAIVDLAERHAADLIIVGTRQHSLISSILGLSVSGTVKRKAHCDVLTVQ
ncbi:universal stress protein [Gaiella sp.]|uniref:universal stress protein n=1 Tax=Gaiella sp. TaxID=2663207 RepID=UPI0032662F9F